jgi:hypothetical protein
MFAQLTSPPPLPCETLASVGILLGAALAGAAMLLWGRYAGRVMFMLGGGAAGWWVGGVLAARLGVNLLAAQATTAVAAALLALLLTPLLWAMAAGGLAGSIALYFLVIHYWPTLGKNAPRLSLANLDFRQYCESLATYLEKCVAATWEGNATAVGVLAGAAAGCAIIICLIRLRMAGVIMSSLVGGAALVAGLAAATGTLFGDAAPVLWAHWFILAGGGVAMAIVGVGVQYRRLLKADKARKSRQNAQAKERNPAG